MKLFTQVLFFLLAIFSLTPFCGPPLALFLGIGFALAFGTPYQKEAKRWSKFLLQAAVVGLGFGLDLSAVLKAGSEGILFTIVTISGALVIGITLGKLLKVERKPSLLIAVGTAICGGSAIAAVGPVIQASDEEMSVALGTVFVLNAIALGLFPLIGHALNMGQDPFGLWAALAIHDTSSVVGATTAYGARAAEVGTTVKLSRALWIIPISLLFAFLERRRAIQEATAKQASAKPDQTSTSTAKPKLQIPWFIGLFLLASLSRTIFPGATEVMGALVIAAKAALCLTLFLIGAGLSLKVLKHVGYRPMLTGVILWVIVGTSTLLAVLAIK
ncbi:MAG: putative sulfate exporter family transporter [Candidatus Kapaibacterium sp.]|jgi:uncharacterized integral membrane protein (TIGR00698 family)